MTYTRVSPENLNITRGNPMHRALWALSGARELTTKQIRLKLGSTNRSDIAFRDAVLTPMHMAGLIGVRPTSSDLWYITTAGIEHRLSVGDLPDFEKLPEKTAKNLLADAKGRGPYVPLELTEPIVRPGAYDAFDLPSMNMGNRRWRDRRGVWHDSPVTAA